MVEKKMSKILLYLEFHGDSKILKQKISELQNHPEVSVLVYTWSQKQ